MCSARRLMVFNVCVKFHENMSSGFKVMERTRKLLTDTHTHTHTQRKDENIIPPWHTSYAGGITSSEILIRLLNNPVILHLDKSITVNRLYKSTLCVSHGPFIGPCPNALYAIFS